MSAPTKLVIHGGVLEVSHDVDAGELVIEATSSSLDGALTIRLRLDEREAANLGHVITLELAELAIARVGRKDGDS